MDSERFPKDLRRFSWTIDSIGLALLISGIWVYAYLGFDLAMLWSAPVRGYEGDGIYALALIKAYASSDITAFLPKFNARLNAPFVANWNDFPFEDLIYAAPGLSAKLFGLFPGVNVYLMMVHIASGLSFYAVARILGYVRPWCLAGALIYAFSTFSFYRGLPHLSVATVWHLPFLLLTVVWLNRPEQIRISPSRMVGVGVVTSAVTGLQNPYYLALFFFLLSVTLAGQLLARDRQQVARAIVFIVVAAATFFVQHVDTLSFAYEQGRNTEAVSRDLAGLTTWGLRLSDLIFPYDHRVDLIAALSRSIYHSRIPLFLAGESQLSYVGLVALVGLLLLAVIGTARLAARRFEDISNWYWVALGVFAFAVVGGLNYVAGALGFELLRATTRYSIVLMLVGLFFLGELLSKREGGKLTWLVLLVVPLALYDQIWPSLLRLAERQRVIDTIEADRTVVTQLEAVLHDNAMVFQIPVKSFPEAGVVNRMHDYDHFIPYLHSTKLRYSYGTIKGRHDADWQADVGALRPEQMILELERFGFSALLVNREAYTDAAEKLITDLEMLGRPVIAVSDRLLAIQLAPDLNPSVPAGSPPLLFGEGFSGLELDPTATWRWSTQAAATITIGRSWMLRTGLVGNAGKIFEFSVSGLQPCNVWVSFDGSQETQVLSSSEVQRHVRLPIDAASGDVSLAFRSDCVPKQPSDGDPRKLAFQLRNFSIQ